MSQQDLLSAEVCPQTLQEGDTETGVLIEAGCMKNVIPILLITRQIRGATIQELDDGRSRIMAPQVSRKKLLSALKSLPGVWEHVVKDQ